MIKISVFILLLSFFTPGLSQKINETKFDQMALQFKSLSFDKSKVAKIKDLRIQRDAGVITLSEGTLYFLTSLNGKTPGFLFLGSGDFEFTPPSKIEKKQLFRFLEKESLHEPFTNLFVLFTDSTFNELVQKVVFETTIPLEKTGDALEEAKKYILFNDQTVLNFDVRRAFLSPVRSQWFYAHIWDRNNRPLFFKIDDNEFEEVTLSHKIKQQRFFNEETYREVISSFHKQNSTRKNDEIEFTSPISIASYDLDVTLDQDLKMYTKCTITGICKQKNIDWVPLLLYYELELDSAKGNTSLPILTKRYDQSRFLWLFIQDTLQIGDSISVTFFYSGTIFQKVDFWNNLKSSTNWYPKILDDDLSKFDMRFHSPSQLTLIASGENINNETVNGTTTSHWKIDQPSLHASFSIQKYDKRVITTSDLTTINFYYEKSYVHSRFLAGDENDFLAHDLENSFHFFAHLFGKPAMTELNITEIVGNHGQAFPGYIHLSWITFQNQLNKSKGFDEFFRAHEIAHMWWGLGVWPKSYHDYWLSEGFATYSGLWYMQTVKQDNELFFQYLADYKKDIIKNRNYLFSQGQESGPIILGPRTQSSSATGDYQLIIYWKGAWVLHMLRNMSLDLKTMKEDIFQNTLKEYYQTYDGGRASTRDFQRIAEKYIGADLTWFFDQWVNNIEIPTYNILYKGEQLPDGKYKVHCTVKQTNVSENFQAYVIFKIVMGENRFARLRILIKGPITEFDFPKLPLKPEEIKFNDLESVLCEIDDEDWD